MTHKNKYFSLRPASGLLPTHLR